MVVHKNVAVSIAYVNNLDKSWPRMSRYQNFTTRHCV